MLEQLKAAEANLTKMLNDPGKWNAVIKNVSDKAHTLTAWRELSPSYDVVIQLLKGDRSVSLVECNPYIMRVVSGVCNFVQAIELEDKKLELLASGELAAGTIYNQRDTDCWHSLRPHKRDVLLLRVSKNTSDNDYYDFDDHMEQKTLEWMLKQFLPVYENKK